MTKPPRESRSSEWRERARTLRLDVHALYLACRDPRVPWYAKLWAGCVAAYALSPIDLIPDAIPVLGYLDDLVLLPIGIYLAIKLVPSDVMADCRRQARALDRRVSRVAAAMVVAAWVATAAALATWLVRRIRD
jgi:uncharacterized membrane protein YkvA (DUF1232 family)